jgi:hypothetical protein
MPDKDEYVPGADLGDGGRFDYLPPAAHDVAAFGRVVADESTDADDTLAVIAITAGEVWDHYGPPEDGDQILSGRQRDAVGIAVQLFRAHAGAAAEDGHDPEDARYDSPEGQLSQTVAAAIMTASTLFRRYPDRTALGAWSVLLAEMMGDRGQYAAVWQAITAQDTADDPLAQAARDAMMPYACGECGTEADAPGREPDHFGWCSRYAAELAPWEVAFGAARDVEALTAERAATRATAELDVETSDKYYEGDPNPGVFVRRKGGSGPWQLVHLDDAAVQAEIAAIRAEDA